MVKKNTKEKLIETALDLIWKNSYSTVSVDDICTSAGVLKGSFYHYFPSKKDLAHAALQNCRAEFRRIYDEIFSPLTPALERFEKLADFKIEMQEKLYKKHGYVLGCPTGGFRQDLGDDAYKGDHELENFCLESLIYYQAALRDLISEGLIDSNTDVKQRAEEIYIFITGTMTMARMTNDLGFLRTSFKPSLMRIVGLVKELA